MQCSAKLENGDRCLELCEDNKQFCRNHGRKFYTSYISYKQVCSKAENRQKIVDDASKATTPTEISTQMIDLLKAYASAEKCYEMRKSFIDTNVHPDAQDKGHKNEKHYWRNLITQYEDLLFVLFEKQQSAEKPKQSRISQPFEAQPTSNTNRPTKNRKSKLKTNAQIKEQALLENLKNLRFKCKPVLVQLTELFSKSSSEEHNHYNEMIRDDDKFENFLTNPSSKQIQQFIDYCKYMLESFETAPDPHADMYEFFEQVCTFEYDQTNIDFDLIQLIRFTAMKDLHSILIGLFEIRELNVSLCNIYIQSLQSFFDNPTNNNKKKYLSVLWKLLKGLAFENFLLLNEISLEYKILTTKIKHIVQKGRFGLLLQSNSKLKGLAPLIVKKLKFYEAEIKSGEFNAALEKQKYNTKVKFYLKKLPLFLEDDKPEFQITKELASIKPTEDQKECGFANFFT